MTISQEMSKAELKRQNTIIFIKATQELIEKDGLQGVSIRKVAQNTPFHNSTLYLYFDDLDELIMLASLKYFRKYLHDLSILSEKKGSITEEFLGVWKFFLETVFEKPDIFYNFFFGKKSNDLFHISNLYYEIFSEEMEPLSPIFKAMYFGTNLVDRTINLTLPMLEVNPALTKEDIILFTEATIGFTKIKLEKKRDNPEIDSQKIISDIMKLIERLFLPLP